MVAELGLRGIEVNGVDEFMSKEQKPEYAEVVNGFYSPIEQGLLDIKETELPANEWIKKLQGFTEQDELKYTGIEEWLKQQGKVTGDAYSEISAKAFHEVLKKVIWAQR